MPCWWMPDWWRKALAPTMALLGWTTIPVSCETSRLVRWIWVVSTLVVTPKKSLRVFSAITTSSRAALPARSPRPLTQTSTWRAPARTAARLLATERPRAGGRRGEGAPLDAIGEHAVDVLRLGAGGVHGRELHVGAELGGAGSPAGGNVQHLLAVL